MISKNLLGQVVTAAVLLGAGSVQAASVTYNLTLSSDDLLHISNTGTPTGNIPSGNTYATVTIDDEGGPGLINFTVNVGAYWAGKEDSGFGIDSFGFNVLAPEGANGLTSSMVTGLAANWGANVDYSLPNPIGIAQDGYGKFDAVVSTSSAANRLSTVTFSINNTYSVDTISSYIDGSLAGLNGSHFFAVHVAGFDDQNPLAPVGTCVAGPLDANNPDCNLLTSSWTAGSTAVPVPAAAWLFGSGLSLLAWMRRKAKS